MAIRAYPFFYDAQTRRFLEQIVRAFSGFQWKTGRRNGNEPEVLMVPCRMATRDRMVAHLMRNQSENALLTVPAISVSLMNITGRRADVQNPYHVDTRQVVEREVRSDGTYGPGRGNGYSVERLMPRPFEMTVQVDVWTSNMETKLQLLEQIMTIIYPDFDIQSSDNPLDWSAMSRVIVEDMTFSNVPIPVGTENEIDFFTISLRVPYWLSPPSLISRQRLIEQIVANINDMDEDGQPTDRLSQQVITIGDHWVRVSGSSLTLLGPGATDTEPSDSSTNWMNLLNQYGAFENGVSTIRLKPIGATDVEETPEIIGTIQTTMQPNVLHWTVDIDTLPANSLGAVDAVIDPLRTYPGNGLAAPAIGQRYLLIEDIGPSMAWGNITAYANDIIEYTSSGWTIDFDASAVNTTEHVLNTFTGKQFRWTGSEWQLSIDGEYAPGYWRISL
jgi:hypothetical protein